MLLSGARMLGLSGGINIFDAIVGFAMAGDAGLQLARPFVGVSWGQLDGGVCAPVSLSRDPCCRLKPLGYAVLGQADAGTRTPDPLLTMAVLYQLSYVGTSDES